jgi:TonB family protein
VTGLGVLRRWCALAALVCAVVPAWAQSQRAQVTFAEKFEYPAVAVRREEEGLVRLRLTVATDGSVRGVQLLRTSGYRSLDRHAIFLAQAARGQAALDAQGKPVSSTIEVEPVYQLDPPIESRDDQGQPIEERVRRRVLRNYTAAVIRSAAKGGHAVAAASSTLGWPAGRRVLFQAEVLPMGSLQKIALLGSSGDAELDSLAYGALLETGSIPLAQPLEQPAIVQIELR